MDGANLNAMPGLVAPGKLGVDVMHINLHKTLCIPHGGGGPGMGPICVAPHLVKYLPCEDPVPLPAGSPGRDDAGYLARLGRLNRVSSASQGSALILLISWAYLRLMGTKGVQAATAAALLAANYMAARLSHAYPILFLGQQGTDDGGPSPNPHQGLDLPLGAVGQRTNSSLT
jgi:glycine dehydrogenase